MACAPQLRWIRAGGRAETPQPLLLVHNVLGGGPVEADAGCLSMDGLLCVIRTPSRYPHPSIEQCSTVIGSTHEPSS